MENILEEAVRGAYESLRASNPQYCGCNNCREDVIALALNQTRARYVVGNPLGAALTRVTLGGNQMQAELSVLVLDAMRRVERAPRHHGGNGGSAH